jgi:hypothetical protein
MRPALGAGLAVAVVLAVAGCDCCKEGEAAEVVKVDGKPALTSYVADEGWGTIKGQVVFKGNKLPPNPEVNLTNDKKHCESKGPILRNELVVNPKNKGVRWVLVWLAPVKEFKDVDAPIPTHSTLKKIPEMVEIDQPVCVFTPRVIGMREGTRLVYKNSEPIQHNVSINGGPLGPTVNRLLPPAKGKLEFKEVKARLLPFSYSCTIHPWMKGWIGVFKHPYYTVTDENGNFEIKNAPAGKWRLMVWQEKVGWVIFKDKDHIGRVISIKDKGTTTEKIDLEETDD